MRYNDPFKISGEDVPDEFVLKALKESKKLCTNEGSGGVKKLGRKLAAQDKAVSKSIENNPPFSDKTKPLQTKRVATAKRLGKKKGEGEVRPLKRQVAALNNGDESEEVEVRKEGLGKELSKFKQTKPEPQSPGRSAPRTSVNVPKGTKLSPQAQLKLKNQQQRKANRGERDTYWAKDYQGGGDSEDQRVKVTRARLAKHDASRGVKTRGSNSSPPTNQTNLKARLRTKHGEERGGRQAMQKGKSLTPAQKQAMQKAYKKRPRKLEKDADTHGADYVGNKVY